MAIISISVGNVMGMVQPNTVAEQANGITLPEIKDQLNLAQSVTLYQSPHTILLGNTLALQQSVRWNPKKISVISPISFQDHAGKAAISISVGDYLAMSGSTRTVLAQATGNQLTFINAANYTRSFTSGYGLTQTVAMNIRRNLLPQSTLTISQGVGVIKAGSTTYIPVTVPTVAPQKVQLTYGSWTLILDSPLFGDVDEIEHLRINRETRAGERVIFHDPTWPVVEKLTYNFDNLNEQKKTDLLNFINVSLGQLVTMIDYNGITWRVMITNPDLEIAQKGDCSYEAQIEFEGSRA